MTRILTPILVFLALFQAPVVDAQTVAAGRTIRSKSIILESDLVILTKSTPGAFASTSDVVGLEARVVLYPGRPIRPSDVGPPAVVERNQIVTLIYVKGALFIAAEGRALTRGGIGDRVRFMNLSSRSTLTGTVSRPGEIEVSQ